MYSVTAGRLASSISSTAIFLPVLFRLADRKVDTMPVIMLAPVVLVAIWPKAFSKIPTVSAVVRVLPLVPVTTTIS